jgi:hypothetical protein
MRHLLRIDPKRKRVSENPDRRKRILRLVSVAGLLGCAVLVSAIDAYNPGKPTSGPTIEQPASPAQSRLVGTLVEAEVVKLRASGFEPSEITRTQGRFFLSVENWTAPNEISIQLHTKVGSPVRSVTVPREELEWADLLDLPPGEYVLTESSQPDQVCRIKIVPK